MKAYQSKDERRSGGSNAGMRHRVRAASYGAGAAKSATAHRGSAAPPCCAVAAPAFAAQLLARVFALFRAIHMV